MSGCEAMGDWRIGGLEAYKEAGAGDMPVVSTIASWSCAVQSLAAVCCAGWHTPHDRPYTTRQGAPRNAVSGIDTAYVSSLFPGSLSCPPPTCR